jgi:phosphatidylserine/phosphatidylglycerophosphate/cardiolipin synthase-like enzyme
VIKTLVTLLLLLISMQCAFASNMSTIFTPYEDGTAAYISWLNINCHQSLYIIDFTFTSEPITEEYITLAHEGISVNIILDQLEYNAVKVEKSLVARLRAAGCKVYITTSPVKHAICHSKYTICDLTQVSDGSFNYSSVADNQCNTINFSDDPGRAALFKENWDKVYLYATTGK